MVRGARERRAVQCNTCATVFLLVVGSDGRTRYITSSRPITPDTDDYGQPYRGLCPACNRAEGGPPR